MDQEAVGLFHLANSGECSWFAFAREVFDLAGVQVTMEAIDTGQTQRRAVRPPYSALTSVRLEQAGVSPLRPWQEALREYLQIKGLAFA